MNTYISIIVLYACVTYCSTKKDVDETTKSEKEAEPVYDYYNGRPVFKSKDAIPESYIDYLTDFYGINEDPLAKLEGRDIPKDEHVPNSKTDKNTETDKATGTEKDKMVEKDKTIDKDKTIEKDKTMEKDKTIEKDKSTDKTTSTDKDKSTRKDDDTPKTDKETTSEPSVTTEHIDTTVIDSNSTDANATGGCKVCEEREELKLRRIASIKKQILSKLGFSDNNLPNVTKKQIPRTPSFNQLIEQYEMQGDAPYGDDDDYYQEDNYYGEIHRAYTIGQEPLDEFGQYPSGGCYFDIPESVRSKKIQDATLWVYLEKPQEMKKRVTEIFIYIVPEKAKAAHLLKGPIRYSKTSSYGWQDFKMAHIVHHWVKRPEANKGIIIQAFDAEGNNLAIVPQEGANEEYYPTLEMATSEHRDKKHRSKRSFNNVCTENDRIDACCRYPLRVDFVAFGWDWVIAPTGYRANYCSGECTFRHIDDSPNSYLVQQIPDGNGDGPCCTPNKYFPLAMLYFDHARTVLYTYMQKMIVRRCGCA